MRRIAPALVAAAFLGLVMAVPQSASAACATNTHKAISGTIHGQDGRDVNVSIGFDVVDRNLNPVNADPRYSDYGCSKDGVHGGYSVPQKEYNHFVGYQGVAPGTVLADGSTSTHTWTLTNLPSDATGVWVEVYSRGYTGSPCRDASGNYCFNNVNVTRYGFANRHYIPIGASNVSLRLPLTCGAHGTTGQIAGSTVNSAGSPVTYRSVYAWTELRYADSPSLQGWGIASLSSGHYTLKSLAGGQHYTVWATTAGGALLKRTGVYVSSCHTTPLSFRG